VQFAIVGPLEIRGGSQITSPQERVLLGLLLLRRNRVVSTDVVEEALWGTNAPRTRRLSLQSKVSRLRSVIGSDRLRFTAEGYRLVVEPGECDVDEIEMLANQLATSPPSALTDRLALLDEALSHFRGPLLGELCHESFVEGEAVRLEQRHLSLAEDRLATLLALGRPDDVLVGVEPLSVVHPFDERLCELRMAALAMSGRVVDALREYQTFRSRLIDQVGVDPSAALVAIERQLLTGEPEPPSAQVPKSVTPAAPAVGATGSVPARPPDSWKQPINTRPRFVGRERTVAAARRVIMTDGAVRACVLAGDGGIGKTRVVMELLAAATVANLPTKVLRCRSGYGQLLVPFPSEAGAAERWSEPDARRHLIGRVTANLQSEIGNGVLVVEDLHWADEGTLEVITTFVAEAIDRNAALTVIISTRPLVESDPRAAWLSAFARSVPTTSIQLDGFTEPEVFQLVHEASGTVPDPSLSDVLHHRAGGNPLLALTGLESLRSRNGLFFEGRTLRANKQAFRLVPADLRSALDELISGLRPLTRQFLNEVALTVDGIAIADLPAFVEVPEQERLDAIAEAERAGLIESATATITFRHDLYRRILAELQTPSEIAARHHMMFRHLWRDGIAPHGSPHALAHHAEQSDGAVKADIRHRVMVTAGMFALERTDWALAARWFRHVLTLHDELGFPAGDVRSQRFHAGAALFRNHDAELAVTVLNDVANEAAAAGDIDMWGLALLDYCRAFGSLGGTLPPPPRTAVERYVNTVGTQRPALCARLLSLSSEHHFAYGDNTTAHTMIDRALEFADRQPDPVLRAEIAFAIGLTHLGDLKLDTAIVEFERSVHHARTVGSTWVMSWGLGRNVYARLIQGDLAGASTVAQEALMVQRQAGQWGEMSFTLALQAHLADRANDDEETELNVAEADRLIERSGFVYTAPLLFPLLVQRAIAAQDIDALNNVMARWEQTEHRVPKVFQALHTTITQPASPTLAFRPITSASIGPGHLPMLAAQIIIATITQNRELTDISIVALDHLADIGVGHLPSARVGVDELRTALSHLADQPLGPLLIESSHNGHRP
jgi:DNA-binding SARP family transcriptional activator